MNMRMQALKELMGMSGDLLGQKPYEQTLTEKPKPWWQEFLSESAGTAAKAGAQYATGGF
jgi:hypothetical protein